MKLRRHEAAHSFEEIGKKVGCTPERARQIYEAGMTKIRDYLRQHPYYAEELFKFLAPREQQNPQCPRIPEGDIPEPD